MKELARAYIEKRIQNAKTKASEEFATKIAEAQDEWSSAKPTQFQALAVFFSLPGSPDYTASCLARSNRLTVSEKGKILAKAYAGVEEREARDKLLKASGLEVNVNEVAELALTSKKIAQGLARAAKRVQNS